MRRLYGGGQLNVWGYGRLADPLPLMLIAITTNANANANSHNQHYDSNYYPWVRPRMLGLTQIINW